MTPSERYQKIIENVRFLAGKGASNDELSQYLNYEGLTGKDFISLLEGPTFFGQVGEAFKGLVPGAVGLVETAATGVASILPEDMEQSVRQTIQDAATSVKEPFKAAPGYEETVGRKLGEAVGSTVPFLAAGPFGLAGRAAAVGLGTAAGAGEARLRAEQEGATEGERAGATALGIIPGALEAFAPLRILSRIPTDEVITGTQIAKRALVAGGEEGAQEALSGWVQNLIAKGVYKPEQELIEGLGEQAAYGAGAGAIIQGVMDLIIPGKQRAGVPPPTQPEEPATPPAPTPVGVPADAEQLGLFPEEEMPVALTPDESVYAMREESMLDEARRQQALTDADELRGMFDILQRENERLATEFDRAETDEDRNAIRKKAQELAPQLRTIEKELKKVETKLPKEDRGRPTAAPEQMGLDFDMPLMERQKTGEGVVLGEGPEAAPESLTQEQQTFFEDAQTQSIRDRLADGEPVTPADMARLRLSELKKAQAIQEAPTPDIVTPEERPEGRPPLSLQRTDIEQPSAAPREPITVTPEGEAIIGRPEVEERRVSEDDFTQMGIGKTNKKLREQLIGKDIADPTQRDEVRSALEDFANAPNRSEKLRTGVENFLNQPMFMEQMGLDLQPRRKPRARKPKEPVGQPSEPSVPPPSPEGTAPSGIGAFVAQRVGTAGDISGVPDAGEGVQQPTMRREFLDSARKTYNRIRDPGTPSWRELTFDQQMEFLDAFEEVRPNIPRYRLAEPGTKGMPADQVTKLVNRLTAKWQNPPDIFVVQSVDELVEYGLDDIDPSAKGIFEPGTQSVFLIADNITGYNDAVLTVAHESIGHFGLQSVLGEQYKQTMNRLYQNPDVKKAADAKMKADTGLTKEIAVEEVIAEAVERKLAPQSGLARAVATLRNLLRNFFNKLGAKASNSEIDSLIAQSANYVVAGTVQVEKAVTNTDAFKQWFGDSVIRNPDGSPKIMYHGTAADITEFKPKQAAAIFVTDSPDFADTFTQLSENFLLNLADIKKVPYTGGRNIMPLYVRAERPFDYENRAHVDALMSRFSGVDRAAIEKGMWSAIEGPRAQQAIKDLGFDSFYVSEGGKKNLAVYEPNQVKSATGNEGTFRRDTGDIRYRKAEPTPTGAGQSALNTIEQMGRKYEEPTTGYLERIKKYWNNENDNPDASQKTARSAITKFTDQVETWTFSPDAALNNQIRRQVVADAKSNEELIGTMLNISMSQTVHDDALANLALMEGKVEYDPSTYKYVAVKDKNSFVTLATQINEIANKYGLTVEKTEAIGQAAFEARRLNGLREYNKRVEEEAVKLESQNKKGLAERRRQDIKFIHMSDAQIDQGLSLLNTMPELNNLVDTWNGMRANHLDVMVKSGLYTVEEADFLLSKMDYVPFIREEQIEDKKGPKEYLTGLGVNARDKGFKGSDQTVNDIFDNMARWTQYAIKRSIRNRNAVALIDTAVANDLAKKVEGPTRGSNTVRVWRNGIEEFYDMADPMYMDAFKGLESVVIPTLSYMTKLSNLLRRTVVLYPLFSVSQIPQDAFAAMFSSGLKTRFALTVPFRVVKEYVKTLSGSSRTHEELKKYGVVGVRDFSSAIARADAEVYSGLKQRKGLKGLLQGVENKLEFLAMASDNAVRQAVYETALAQGLTKAEAIEKAFEIINFRRRGTSKMINIGAQVIPFFNAYLSAQNVAIKTISGVGISPGDRAAALRTLAATTGATMALSLIYAMMISDDEDYLDKPPVVRDRLLMIPGTGGLSVPLRPDIFSLPKILTEHTYLLMTNNGTQDGRKFRDSMANALVNAVSSPTLVPQAIKPFVEVNINYNFFQGRPLVGIYQQNLELERQFNDSTSELAKLIGSTGLMSPINADHIIRGVLGTTGGLMLYMTNKMLHSDPMVPRPELSFKDAIATFPGMSPFVSREYGTALKNDFYVLREEVDRAVDTLNDIERRSPQDILEFLADEKNINRVGISKVVNAISNELGEIRRTISEINNSAMLNAQQKRELVKELREYEKSLLKSVDLKELRRVAQL